MPKKQWFTSKTIWAGIVTVIRGAYLVAQQTYPTHLPAIPPYVDAALSTFLGGAVIHGRWTAETTIGQP